MVTGEIFVIARFAHCNDHDQRCWFVGIACRKSVTVHNCSR